MALERVQQIGSQISSTASKASILTKWDSDVVICGAVRTPITKSKKGGLKDTCPEEMLSAVLRGLVERTGVDKTLVEDIAVGTVLQKGSGATTSRMGVLHAGFPTSTAVNAINRQCSSGLAATQQIANEIALGQIEIGIGAGVESMTLNYGADAMPAKMSDDVMENEDAADCLLPMGITSENVATQFGITRQTQDEFAAKSFAKAVAAQKAGKFKSEIIPMHVKWTDPKSEEEKEIDVVQDDGLREGITAEGLSKLKPAFSKTGTTHAGNASQVSDGAAAVLLARRSVAKKLGLPILGKFVSCAVVGVKPDVMGIGPAFAIPRVLEIVGLSKDDVDFYEINEAFASQAVYSIEKLGIPYEKVNPVGGAIAFGHPLGATGARQIATGYAEAKRSGASIFVTSMCIGTGMGAAAVFTNEQ
ncbi:uncharacterized protein L969DRAFT_85226 [Mixia osmundae IAM 14324]|uniref:Thiolase n=1 Tax=Mixia osmundae (strain CBS 9802 / IAM 14324 / JCM 22182 / KY 12970) TaxID=764103 RepID=G7DY77_MIXOS|nr:uncharacterized protein L969DRAFT_85226 [Mixia osmundae IAM 14324]KEI41440.1 hypothetical protein L969DRAFT_85226 [Mixia osmundae IAM 14324]GAA95537.1 hypothetical protein E5Q_02192 [Mixia osmundae IAM 14324]